MVMEELQSGDGGVTVCGVPEWHSFTFYATGLATGTRGYTRIHPFAQVHTGRNNVWHSLHYKKERGGTH